MRADDRGLIAGDLLGCGFALRRLLGLALVDRLGDAGTHDFRVAGLRQCRRRSAEDRAGRSRAGLGDALAELGRLIEDHAEAGRDRDLAPIRRLVANNLLAQLHAADRGTAKGAGGQWIGENTLQRRGVCRQRRSNRLARLHGDGIGR